MKTNTQTIPSNASMQSTGEFLHLVCGAGGSRAILASAGFNYALAKAGLIEKLRTIGGASGGAFPSLLISHGFSAAEVVNLCVSNDFAARLDRKKNKLQTLIAFLFRKRFEQTKPLSAVFGSESLGAYLDSLITVWPKRFWTVALHGDEQILFTADGVYRCPLNGNVSKISDKPARVSDALRATMAVPGIIEPLFWRGMQLTDGGLSWDGVTPIAVVVKHLAANPGQIIACHVGHRKAKGLMGKLMEHWNQFLARHNPWSEEMRDPARWAAHGVEIVSPSLDKFGSLKFSLSEEDKWEAVRIGYKATVDRLHSLGFINESQLRVLSPLAESNKTFKRDCAK